MTVGLFNEDITSEVWKYLSFSVLKIVSEVSKDFFFFFKKMTIADKAKARYKEIGSFSKFCSAIVDETCINYGYKKPKFITTFNKSINFRYNNTVDEYFESNNINLIADILVITTHAVNKKYHRIVKKIRMTDYTALNNDQVTLHYFLDILNSLWEGIFKKCYSLETSLLLRILWTHHLFRISKNQFKNKKSFRNILKVKKNMLKEYIEKSLNRYLYPNYFTKALLIEDIYE